VVLQILTAFFGCCFRPLGVGFGDQQGRW
jgi:hypothetical protein